MRFQYGGGISGEKAVEGSDETGVLFVEEIVARLSDLSCHVFFQKHTRLWVMPPNQLELCRSTGCSKRYT